MLASFNRIRFKTSKQPVIFKKLNRKLFCSVFKYLSTEDLSRLSRTSRRLNNLVQYYMRDLQVLVDWGDGEPILDSIEFNYVILRDYSLSKFFYPDSPFKYVKNLYLCFENLYNEKINLINWMSLRYLKLRGPLILLSSNKIAVTHIDIEDPYCCEKQIFPNMKLFHLELNVEDFSQLHNTTEPEAVRYTFCKTLDIVLDKKHLEQVSFTIIIPNLELLLFEKLVDCVSDFVRYYNEYMENGHIDLRLKYQPYEVAFPETRRWEKAWKFLTDTLVDDYENFNLTHECETENYIPVI